MEAQPGPRICAARFGQPTMRQALIDIIHMNHDDQDIDELSTSFLEGFAPERVVAIVAEAKRYRARLSSIPWYAEQERKTGARLWLNLAISYRGEE